MLVTGECLLRELWRARAAAPLLQESVRGITAVYGAEHPVTKRYAANMAENQLRWEEKRTEAEPAEGGG